MHSKDIPGSRLARLTVAALFANAAAAAVMIGVSLVHLSLLRRVLAGREVPDEQFFAIDDWTMLVGWTQAALTLVTAVLFILWLHRARLNLRTARVGGLDFAPGWAIGAWFIPVINLVAPYMVTREVWAASGPVPPRRMLLGGRPVAAWWGAWVLMTVLVYPVREGIAGDASAAQYQVFTAWIIASSVATLAAAWLAVRVVREVTDKQRVLHAGHAEAARVDPDLALA